MAIWTIHDTDNWLLRKWLNGVNTTLSLPANAATSWRVGDSNNDLFRKLLRAYCVATENPPSSPLNYRVGDGDNVILKKILFILRAAGTNPLPGAQHEWRPMDSDRGILAKILTQLCQNAAIADPRKRFLPQDSELAVLRKIVATFP